MSEHMAYAGYCKECGQMTAVTADIPGREKETGRDVQKMIAWGLEVRRVDKAKVKRDFNECLCRKDKRGKQDELFS